MFSEKQTLEEDYMRKDFINCPSREDGEGARRLGELSDLEASLTRIKERSREDYAEYHTLLGSLRKIQEDCQGIL